MKQTDYKFYAELKLKAISLNRTPKAVKGSSIFKNLLGAGILDTEKSGRGTNVVIRKQSEYDNFLKMNFPAVDNLTSTKSNNIRQFKSSKARRTQELPMYFLRGFKPIEVADITVDLEYHTKTFGFFGLTIPSIKTENICFVENKNTFLNAENLLGQDWIYIHSYGRIGKENLKKIVCNKVLAFVDYDFNGLDEFLRIKNQFIEAELFIPDNFNELYNTYSTHMKGKQKASKKVSESEIPQVVMLRNLVQKSNKFLEQEILIND
ncbi:MAG: DUF2220 family protein [Ferruginibacter sp.]